MLIISAAALHVATDWPAFGLFFLGLVGSMGTFTAWILRRQTANRNEWKEFVQREVQTATTELGKQVSALSESVAGNTREIVDQGKAIARIEGALGSKPPSVSQV